MSGKLRTRPPACSRACVRMCCAHIVHTVCTPPWPGMIYIQQLTLCARSVRGEDLCAGEGTLRETCKSKGKCPTESLAPNTLPVTVTDPDRLPVTLFRTIRGSCSPAIKARVSETNFRFSLFAFLHESNYARIKIRRTEA